MSLKQNTTDLQSALSLVNNLPDYIDPAKAPIPADAIAALTEKGVDVASGADVSTLAGLIAAIEAGGGKMCSFTFTPAETIAPPYVFTHNLGVVPDFYVIWTRETKIGDNNLSRMSLICPMLDDADTYLASLIYRSSSYNQQLGGMNGGYLVTASISSPYNTLIGSATASTFTYVTHSNYNGNIGLRGGVTYNIAVGRLLNE